LAVLLVSEPHITVQVLNRKIPILWSSFSFFFSWDEAKLDIPPENLEKVKGEKGEKGSPGPVSYYHRPNDEIKAHTWFLANTGV
jgi:hypothetical protein